MPHPDPRRDRQPLRVLIGADGGIDQLVGDRVGDILAVIGGDGQVTKDISITVAGINQAVPVTITGGSYSINGGPFTASAGSVSNGQTINCARVRLSRVRVVGHDGAVINTGYSTDLEAGTVTFINVSGYSQPVTIEHRIEDMAVVLLTQLMPSSTYPMRMQFQQLVYSAIDW